MGLGLAVFLGPEDGPPRPREGVRAGVVASKGWNALAGPLNDAQRVVIWAIWVVLDESLGKAGSMDDLGRLGTLRDSGCLGGMGDQIGSGERA